MNEYDYDSEAEAFEDFYAEARESFRMFMEADGYDEETIENAIKMVHNRLGDE